jgi:hypothetical protein
MIAVGVAETQQELNAYVRAGRWYILASSNITTPGGAEWI